MHDVMARHVERGSVSGLATLLERHGETHVDAIGMRRIDGSEPIRRDTIFRIASMTKPVTAAAAMILVEECKLRLDEAVDRLLPELAPGATTSPRCPAARAGTAASGRPGVPIRTRTWWRS
jgi:CubicO group peptidase (beta-lactamase class C family)